MTHITPVTVLHPDQTKDDLVAGLRAIADEIEAGETAFDPTMAVIVLADEKIRRDAEGETSRYVWQTHALGSKAGFFTAKGILAAAAVSFDTDGD